MTQSPNDIKTMSVQVQPQSSDKKSHSVYVRNAYKHYGTKKHPVNVLNGLSMTIPRGCIYGLLGASGCGKTTLLNCIVGRKKFDSGEVWVLGGIPGTKDCGVLGNKLGYMPQEMALYAEFSITETLQFYGKVAGMEPERIQERIKFLVDMLMLPEPRRRVENLSTGQQRRVSLAAALVHEPELLILDEPTVGVDPLLREIIWDHFKEITNNGRTTIIITTHYIDETRQANLIAFMRKGVLLAEQAPERLISQFNTETLEEVFLRLSIHQNLKCGKLIFDSLQPSVSLPSTSRIGSADATDNEFNDSENLSLFKYNYNESVNDNEEDHSLKAYSHYSMICKFYRVRALVWKNRLWITSHVPLLIFILTMPFIQIVLFVVCIGHNPRNLNIAFVNYESNSDANCNTTLFCNSSRLSCAYFSYVEARGLNLIYYSSEEEATESVLKGNNYAAVIVPGNYSDSLRRRILRWKWSRKWDIKYSTVEIIPDVANKVIANFVFFHLADSFLNFLKDFLTSCQWKSRFFLPVNVIDPPVYGDKYPNFTDFVVPGIMVAVSFWAGMALTGGAMLIERSEGNLDRFLVVGITALEMMVAHLLSQLTALVYQVIVTMITVFVIFNLTIKGSYVLVMVLQLLTSLCGMCYGFVISTYCKNEQTALQMAMGSSVPIMALSGISWPVEAMHRWLKPITYGIPLTQTTEGMRSLLQRGWDMTNKRVYMGFVSILIWIGIFLFISILLIRFKRD